MEGGELGKKWGARAAIPCGTAGWSPSCSGWSSLCS